MNEIVNKILLTENKFMLKWIENSLNLQLMDHLQKTKKEYKTLKKQEIHDTFIKTN